jgi:hypothetical protein
MFGSGILDTVIGLIFVFLLVSMLVTIINEMIAAILKSRAKWLRLGIGRLIGTEWMNRLYAHPLIEGTTHAHKRAVGDPGPSYIPSRSFANVLMSIVQQNAGTIAACRNALETALDSAAGAGATVESLKAQLSTAAVQLQMQGGAGAIIASDLLRHIDRPADANKRIWLGEVEGRVGELARAERPELTPLLDTLRKLVADGVNAHAGVEDLRVRFEAAISNLLSGPATKVLKEELTAMGKRLQGPYTVADAHADIRWFIDGISSRYVRQMIEELPGGELRGSLLTLFDDARNDVEKLKENIEVWFNNGMDRISGWYKRKSQYVTAGLGLLVAVAMNVDTVLIFTHLQTYPGAREAIVAQATQYAAKNPAPAKGTLVVPDNGDFSGKLALPPADEERTVKILSDNEDVVVRDPSVKVGKGVTEVPFTVDVNLRSVATPGTATISSDAGTERVVLTLAPSLPGQFHTVQDNLNALSIPVGWVSKGTAAESRNGQIAPGFGGSGDVATYGKLLTQHGLGWLLTALAATLGAPFWFDMLNRVISIRAAGKPPEEEPKPPRSVSVPVEPGQSQREADRIRQNEPRGR